MFKSLVTTRFSCIVRFCTQKVPQPLRSKKPRSKRPSVQNFVDFKGIQARGGKGGDGCISFLQLWSNENAGPDGGDGGHGGHVIFKASQDIKDLTHIPVQLRAEDGENDALRGCNEAQLDNVGAKGTPLNLIWPCQMGRQQWLNVIDDKGRNKDCHGKCAEHLIIDVPVGTVIKEEGGSVVGDLSHEGLMFVAAKGGAGGKGNHFFITDTEQAPKISEYGAEGEFLQYTIEIKSMAHVGLIGFPNAGKSTLLRAISRARPKIAPYPFTTLKPHLGIVQYDDYEQIAVADLPGLIPDSHKNKGLGIQFLRHAERCSGLLYIIDVSMAEPWDHLSTLQYELSQFSSDIIERPQLVVANKIDLPEAEENLELLRSKTDLPVIPISAKLGTNISQLLHEIRLIYDRSKDNDT